MAGTFRAGGLSSGIDTNSIVDSLVALQRKPIEKLQEKRKLVDVKVSALAQLTSKLKAFETAARDLSTLGARGFSVSTQPASVGVTTGVGATAGRYSLEVGTLAQAAKARSTPFASGATVAGGSLHIEADGDTFDITLDDGATLEATAEAIRASGAPVTATIINDGTSRHLVLTRTSPGHEIGQPASSALSITETTTGSGGQALGLATVVSAANAQLSIDGLDIERRSNTITDALPGVTLTLQKQTTAAEDLVITDDPAATKAALQKVVDAYNEVIKVVQGELDLKADTDRNKTLGGDPAVRALQSRMQSILVREVGSGDVRTLADLGVKSGRNGTLSIDSATFDRAMASDAGSVDALFDDGLADLASTVVDAFTDVVDGSLTLRNKGLTDEGERIDERIAKLEARVERYQELLIARFTAMEQIVSATKSIGTFLSSREAAQKKE